MKSVPQLLNEYDWTTMPNENRRKEIGGWIYDWENAHGRISTLWRWPVGPHNTYDVEHFIISTAEKAEEILEALMQGEHLPPIEINPETLKRIAIVN